MYTPRPCPQQFPGPPLAAVCLLVLACLAAAPPAATQQVRMQVDNDNFNFWVPRKQRPDFEYTHGARVSVATATAPVWGRWIDADRPVCDGSAAAERQCLMTTWEIGQQIYTPRVNSEEPVQGQRPHAGWLYGSMTATVQGEADRHSMSVEVGVTGPPSLAEFMQTTVHEIAGYWQPLGWHNQIPFEPGILGRYGYARRLAAPEIGGTRVAEMVGRLGVAAGTIVTSGSAELGARLGFHVPRSWGIDDVTAAAPVSAYLVGGIGAEAFLRNLFLDGSTRRPGPRVDKLPLVQRHQVGISLRIRDFEAAYLVTTRTREYSTEPGGHRFSSFGVTVKR